MKDSAQPGDDGRSDIRRRSELVVPGIIQTPRGIVAPYILPSNLFPGGADSDREAQSTGDPPSTAAADAPIAKPASTSGFLGGVDLAEALGVHPTRSDAFFRQLERKRLGLGDDCWHEVRDPRPNSPRFIYRVDAPKIQSLAAKYQQPKSV